MAYTKRLKNRLLQVMYRPRASRLGTRFLSEESKDFFTQLENKLEEKTALLWD